MAYAYPGAGALDYFPCRYGTSRLLFRGPRRMLDRPYVAVLGGTETYGKYVPRPYPTLIEAETGLRMVNLGCVNAGLDVYLNEEAITQIAAQAEVVVVQLVGAQNLTNRFYTVHPRRNDRFLAASPLLKSMFRDVEFTEFHFTRHMLMTLQAVSADRFEAVAEELQAAWLLRMKQLLARLPTKVVLLWMSGQRPPTRSGLIRPDGAKPGATQSLIDPPLVNAHMISAIRPMAAAYVEAISSPAARARGVEGMSFNPLDAPAAAGLPGPAVHEEVALTLAPIIDGLM